MVAQSLLIPQVFHRIWLGGNMPAEFVRYGESFARLHPGWEMRLWTEQNLPKLRNQAAFDAASHPAQKADILRYELLLEYGGVYLDTDFECLKPLDELLKGVRIFSASEDTQWVSIGIMGAVPNHPLFQAVVAELPRALLARPSAPINEQTGPLFFTRVVTARKLKGLDADLVIYPPQLFYPYRIGEEHLKKAGFPQAFAVHHWAGSWVEKGSPHESKLSQSPKCSRILLGLDPERPQAALSILYSFQRLFAPGDRVELGIYAYAEPSLPLLECIQILMRTLVGDPEKMAAVALLSRADLAEMEYVTAYFPSGDEIRDASHMSQVIGAMHELKQGLAGATQVETAHWKALSRDDVLIWAAKRPLSSESHKSASAPSASSDGLSHTAAISGELQGPQGATLYGTALGNGRVMIATRAGHPLLCSADDLSLTPELLLTGEYDRPLSRFLQTRLAEGNVAFDIGANIGLFTVAMARTVGATGHVVAYEALPSNYQFLLDNISMNYLSERCTLLEKAAWHCSESLMFSAPERFLGNGSLCTNVANYNARYPGDRLKEIKVEAVPVQEQLSRFDAISVVKIDVEGAEYQVMRGMEQSLITGRVRHVVFECLATLLGADFEPLIHFLERLEGEHGMRCFRLDQEGRTSVLPLRILAEQGNFTQVVLSRSV
jgi:inositol phosphorylceramide mannosyltransferase catalytic subunit